MPDELEVAKMLTVKAGTILLDHYAQPNVRWKGRGNPVTEADRLASEFLVKELKRIFPKDGMLSEEEADDTQRLECRRVWIIDPLDGTMEFVHHIDEFAVMIGLAVEGAATLGVIYQPVTEKLYYAQMGSGAFLIENHRTHRLRVSSESDPAAMTIALSRSHHSTDVDLIQHKLGITKTVCLGSLGLKAGLICEARAHLYINTGHHTSQWDTCASDVILHEADGSMTDISNRPLRYNVSEVRNLNGIIASNRTIHQQIARTAQYVLKAA